MLERLYPGQAAHRSRPAASAPAFGLKRGRTLPQALSRHGRERPHRCLSKTALRDIYAYTSADLITNTTSRASNFASGRGLAYVRLDIEPLEAHPGELTLWLS